MGEHLRDCVVGAGRAEDGLTLPDVLSPKGVSVSYIAAVRSKSVQRFYSASLETCFAATDLEQRLLDIPDSATCRGAFFNMLHHRASSLGPDVAEEYRRFFRVTLLKPFRMYPLRDYLTRLVVLAQIAFGGNRIYHGIRQLQSGAYEAWADTILGRAALALFDPSLAGILRGIERAYRSRMVVSYSSFRVELVTPSEIQTHFQQEYVYIEYAMVGALEGVMRLCGRAGRVVSEMDGRYRGRVRLLLEPETVR